MRELASVGRRRYWNKLTVYLGAVVLLVGGFVIGAQVQKSYGTSTPAGAAAGARGGQAPGGGGFAGARGGAPGGAGQPGGQPGGAGAPGGTNAAGSTTGTVKLVDGTTVYLQTADGSVLTVKTGGATAVKIAKDGSLKDLKAGDKVTVEGTDSAGTVTATSVIGQPK
jgi:Cu/Ag efflux protein CusF